MNTQISTENANVNYIEEKNVGFWFRTISFFLNIYFLLLASFLITSIIFMKVDLENNFLPYMICCFLNVLLLGLLMEFSLKKSLGKVILGINWEKLDGSPIKTKDIIINIAFKPLYIIEAFSVIFSKQKKPL